MTEETRRDGPDGSVVEKDSEPGGAVPDAAFPEKRFGPSPPGAAVEEAVTRRPIAEDRVAAEGIESQGSEVAAGQEAAWAAVPVGSERDKSERLSGDPTDAAHALAQETAEADAIAEHDARRPAAGEPSAEVEAAEPQSPPSDDPADAEPREKSDIGVTPDRNGSASPHESLVEQRLDSQVPDAIEEPKVAVPVDPELGTNGDEPKVDLASSAPEGRSTPTSETEDEELAGTGTVPASAGEPDFSDHAGEASASTAEADVPAEPVPGELIWSGPEEAKAEAAPTQDAISPAEASSTEASSSTDVAIWQSGEPPVAKVALSAAPAIVAAAATTRPAETPPPPVQPALGARRLGGYVRLAVGIAAVLVLGYAALVVLLSVLYRWVDPPASALMVAQQLSGTRIEQRWVPLRRISPHLVQAVILSEDGAFCRHRGVDWSALGEAIESTREGFARGGSTITMQVVKNLFLWNWRSYVRKAIEIPLAYLVELLWPKARVLEIYLNIAEWGDGIFGAEAAARHYFRKPAANLTPQEAALLAAALPNPLERDPGQPGYLVRRLASNLQARMKAVRTTMGCVRPFAPTR